MKNIAVIFKKQVKDTLKNKVILIQFVLFPVMALVMNSAINIEGMPRNYFVYMFATMFTGMAPLVSAAEIISEEKEKGTLRVLMMSNVKSTEYIIGIGSGIFAICMVSSAVLCAAGRLAGTEALCFMGIMVIGVLTSMMLGAAIGIISKNQMTASAMTVPVMMVFSFLPMLAMFNETIAKISKFTYTQQISNMLNNIGVASNETESWLVIAGNLIVVMIVFIFAYKKGNRA